MKITFLTEMGFMCAFVRVHVPFTAVLNSVRLYGFAQALWFEEQRSIGGVIMCL